MRIIKSDNELSYTRSAIWSDLRHLRQQQIPAGLREAILSRDSLTSRIRRHCQGEFAVTVVSQRWERPLYEEWRALGLRSGEQAIVRQVLLSCSGEPWVFARSVIPARTFRHYNRLNQLGSKPLGELLFKERSMKRGVMEFAMLRQGQALHHCASLSLDGEVVSEDLWGRRSIFHVKGYPLLVCELFLPSYGQNSLCLSS